MLNYLPASGDSLSPAENLCKQFVPDQIWAQLYKRFDWLIAC